MRIVTAYFRCSPNSGQRAPTSTASSAVRPGLNVLAGTRVFVTRRLALFGEYKYNHTSFAAGDFKADYNAHFVVLGMGYHF